MVRLFTKALNGKPARKAILIALVAAVFLAAVQSWLIEPYFEHAAGVLPFDTQSSLNPVAVVIQLGAMNEGMMPLYAGFALWEMLLAFSSAVVFVLIWKWMFIAYPTGMFSMLQGGGILFTPFVAAIFDLLESLGFFILISGSASQYFGNAVELSVLAHRLKFAFEDLRIYLTVFFIVVIVVSLFRRRNQAAKHQDL